MGLLVCIIDDDLVSQFATQYRVKQADESCDLISFDSAKEGLEMYVDNLANEKPVPDILLLDLVMPIMDGWEFLDEFENISDFNIPTDIYILSSFTNSEDRKKAKTHPLVKGYFNKPLTRMDVQKFLQKSRK